LLPRRLREPDGFKNEKIKLPSSGFNPAINLINLDVFTVKIAPFQPRWKFLKFRPPSQAGSARRQCNRPENVPHRHEYESLNQNGGAAAGRFRWKKLKILIEITGP
jgi:hypothetical protein